MTAKRKAASRILKAVHESATDMHIHGLIDLRRMRKYDVLCLPPIQEFSSAKIKELRTHNNLSQAVFAALLNTSVSTVRQWEIGVKHPSGPSLKLLDLLERKGLEVLL
jgi:putative transcriptional regulator